MYIYIYIIVRIAYGVCMPFFFAFSIPKNSFSSNRAGLLFFLQLSCDTPFPPGCCLYCQRTWCRDATEKKHGSRMDLEHWVPNENWVIPSTSSSRFINVYKRQKKDRIPMGNMENITSRCTTLKDLPNSVTARRSHSHAGEWASSPGTMRNIWHLLYSKILLETTHSL